MIHSAPSVQDTVVVLTTQASDPVGIWLLALAVASLTVVVSIDAYRHHQEQHKRPLYQIRDADL